MRGAASRRAVSFPQIAAARPHRPPYSSAAGICAPSSIRRSSSKRTICRRSPRSRRCAAAFLSRFVVALPARHVRSRAR
jgi:hypothetical protein